MRTVIRRILLFLLFLSFWTAVKNVWSDDSQLRVRAAELAKTHAGCGEACKLTHVTIDRAMLQQTFTYDVETKGQVVVVCRRAYISAGPYNCVASGGR